LYRVYFDRAVSACAIVATPGATYDLTLGGPPPPVIRTANAFDLGASPIPVPDAVEVDIRKSTENTSVTSPFFVAVHC
jgi:hypothetical protein